MCYVIQAEQILANLLIESGTVISIQRLKSVSMKIEKELPSVYVDVSRNSLCSATDNFPRMFFWENDRISRASGSDIFFKQSYINLYFNKRLPKNIRRKFLGVLDKC